ncbi:hypothetical protein [Melghirimyces algeriensis]|nr:hypothetical protein [Melghirimyces algeriensis]
MDRDSIAVNSVNYGAYLKANRKGVYNLSATRWDVTGTLMEKQR